MNLPFEYDRIAVGEFGGTTPTTDRLRARARRHPAGPARPHDVVRRRHAQRAARNPRRLVAHGALGRRDRHRRPQHRHLHAAGDGVSVRGDGRGDAGDPAGGVGARRPRQVSVRARRRALDHGARRRRAGGEASGPVGAADRRARRPAGHVHGNAAQPRVRHAPRAGARAGHPGRASAACRPRKRPRRRRCRREIFYDFNMRQDPHWIDRVVDSLGETVYITIDCDGLDPAIMPAVGTPEPGGLSWYETARAAAARHRVATRGGLRSRGALAAARHWRRPNFLCAKLIYKILSYRFGQRGTAEVGRRDQVFFSESSSRRASPVNGESGNSSTTRVKVCCASAGLPASR